jgi:hypothetical protein
MSIGDTVEDSKENLSGILSAILSQTHTIHRSALIRHAMTTLHWHFHKMFYNMELDSTVLEKRFSLMTKICSRLEHRWPGCTIQRSSRWPVRSSLYFFCASRTSAMRVFPIASPRSALHRSQFSIVFSYLGKYHVSIFDTIQFLLLLRGKRKLYAWPI